MELPTNIEITSHRRGLGGRLVVAFKKLVRAVVGPYLRNVFEKEHQEIENRLAGELKRLDRLEDHAFAALGARLDRIELRLNAMEAHMPTVLNYISSFGNTVRQLRRTDESLREGVDYALKRIEFVRNETLFEVKYGGGASAGTEKPQTRILNEAKLASMPEIRLNLGCGHIPVEGYLNVDARELPGVDIVAAADGLPFEKGSVTEIFSSHLIEHFPEEEFRRSILPYWNGLLKPGGAFRAVAPDWETMIDRHAKGDYSFEKLKLVTFGAQDYEGDFHYNMFSREGLKALLEEAGFKDVSFPVVGRVNGDCFEFEVRAVKA